MNFNCKHSNQAMSKLPSEANICICDEPLKFVIREKNKEIKQLQKNIGEKAKRTYFEDQVHDYEEGNMSLNKFHWYMNFENAESYFDRTDEQEYDRNIDYPEPYGS